MSNTYVGVIDELSTSRYLHYLTIAVPVLKRGKSSTVVISFQKTLRNIAMEAAAIVVKDKNALDVTKAAESLELSLKAVPTQGVL